MTSPTLLELIGLAVLVSASFRICVIGMLSVPVTVGALEVTVTMLVTLTPVPGAGTASISACVTMCVAVQVIEPPTASEVDRQLGGASTLLSATVMLVTVVAP